MTTNFQNRPRRVHSLEEEEEEERKEQEVEKEREE